jgi:hypothetical protein
VCRLPNADNGTLADNYSSMFGFRFMRALAMSMCAFHKCSQAMIAYRLRLPQGATILRNFQARPIRLFSPVLAGAYGVFTFRRASDPCQLQVRAAELQREVQLSYWKDSCRNCILHVHHLPEGLVSEMYLACTSLQFCVLCYSLFSFAHHVYYHSLCSSQHIVR